MDRLTILIKLLILLRILGMLGFIEPLPTKLLFDLVEPDVHRVRGFGVGVLLLGAVRFAAGDLLVVGGGGGMLLVVAVAVLLDCARVGGLLLVVIV